MSDANTMHYLSISYNNLHINLLFTNLFGARMFAEQWAWKYFNRPGEWDKYDMYQLVDEWPRWEYINGLYISVNEIEIHDHGVHNLDIYDPLYEEVTL